MNTASVGQIQALPGVGPAIAKKIVEHRSKVAKFTKIDEILNVKGIGKKKLQKMKGRLVVWCGMESRAFFLSGWSGRPDLCACRPCAHPPPFADERDFMHLRTRSEIHVADGGEHPYPAKIV